MSFVTFPPVLFLTFFVVWKIETNRSNCWWLFFMAVSAKVVWGNCHWAVWNIVTDMQYSNTMTARKYLLEASVFAVNSESWNATSGRCVDMIVRGRMAELFDIYKSYMMSTVENRTSKTYIQHLRGRKHFSIFSHLSACFSVGRSFRENQTNISFNNNNNYYYYY
jgi:hypothetical protein